VRRTVLLLLAVVAVGCTSSKQAAPPVTVPVTESTVAPTSTSSTTSKPTTTVSTVPRTTVTTQLSLGPGDATISGTVSGPSGPVDGATVRIERLVGKAVATQDVTTSGGSWQLPSVLGGSYRVRAFKPPDLAQSDVQVFFLAANDRKVIDFKLAAAGGDRILAVVNPSPPRVGQPATLTVTVGTGRVDDQGRPSITPRPGVVLILSAGPGFVVDSVPQVVTDGNGAAAWSVRCTAEGANTLPLTVGAGVTSVVLPACGSAPVVATTTTKAG
jgi:hypothetical protein